MHHNHHHFLHVLKNKELSELYISMALRSFTIALIGIFVPIYLLNNGYSLFEVIIFSIVLNLSHIIFIVPAAKFCAKYGFKHSMFVSIPFLVLFFFMLYSIKIWPIYLVGAIYGLNNAFYYMGYNVDFAKSSDKNKRGQEIGTAKIISSIFIVFGPLLGGIILTVFGFKILFTIAAILLFISIIPLFLTKDIHEPFKFNLKDAKLFNFKKDILPYMSYGAETGASSVFWPIIIYFTVLGSYKSLGLTNSLMLLCGLIFMYFTGKVVDKNKRKVLRYGSLLNAIVWLARTLVITPIQVFMIDSIKGISQTLYEVPFLALSYDKAAKKRIIEYTIFRELSIQFGRTVMFIVILLIGEIKLSLFIGSLGSMLYLLF